MNIKKVLVFCILTSSITASYASEDTKDAGTPVQVLDAGTIFIKEALNTFTVEAKKSSWQPTQIVLKENESALIIIPPKGHELDGGVIYQNWGIIEPKTRGYRPYWGGENKAGSNFVKENVQEGALLVKVGNGGEPVAFSDHQIEMTVKGPGEIFFIANDEQTKSKGMKLAIQRFFQGRDGYQDNEGSVTVEIKKDQNSKQP
jgi:hypothetical protein